MQRIIVYICFLWPMFNSCIYLQNILAAFYGDGYVRLLAYSNLGLILLGIPLVRTYITELSKTATLWFVFYVAYFAFAILASGTSGFSSSLVVALIPVIYFTGFYFFISNEIHLKYSLNVITLAFVTSAMLTILFQINNFSLSYGGIHEFDLDRAGGVYGDANNAALASIMAFLFLNRIFNPKKLILKIIKGILLTLIFYSLFITFSTTGLFTFVLCLVILNFKKFRGIRLLLLSIIILFFYASIFILKSEVQNFDLSEAQTNKIMNIINLLTFEIDKVDNSGRGDLIQNILYYINENPILGNGVEFSIFMRGHNTYLGIWADAGFITFLIFISLIILYYLKLITLKTKVKYFSIAILTTLCIFMMSLQSVLNQPYLIVLFVFIAYFIDSTFKNNGTQLEA